MLTVFRENPCPWPIIVSSHNQTAGKRGQQNTCVWQTWQGYYLWVLSSSSLTINPFIFLQQYLFKERWSFAENYCHACHTRFAMFSPFPSCCIHASSLMTALFGFADFKGSAVYEKNNDPFTILYLVIFPWPLAHASSSPQDHTSALTKEKKLR